VGAEGLIEQTRVVAHRVFAGKLDKEKLGFGERAMVRALKAPEGDFRDWEAIDEFAGEIVSHLSG
jgi:menaquinone-dependent protoporphyrinogen oxidase